MQPTDRRRRDPGTHGVLFFALIQISLSLCPTAGIPHTEESPLQPRVQPRPAQQPARVRDLRQDPDRAFAQADGRPVEPSVMLSEGVCPRDIQEQLGHASVSLTLDSYSHVTPGI